MNPIHILMAIGVAVLWGMGFIVAKAGMDHFSPILLMALRFTLTAMCLVWFFRPPLSLFRDLFWVALVSAAIQYSLTFHGLNGIEASTAALLVQLEVPFGLILAWIAFGDKITLKQVFGIVLAFAGAVFILGEPRLLGKMNYALMVVGGAFTWAVGQVMIKRLGEVNGFVLISGVAMFAAPQLFIASALFEQDQWQQVRSASTEAWAAVIYLGLVMTAVGYAMWYQLLGKYPVYKVMPYLLLLPVTSVFGGIWLLDETLTTKIAIGGCLAVIGVAIITLRRPSAVR